MSGVHARLYEQDTKGDRLFGRLGLSQETKAMPYQSNNPATGNLLKTFPEMTDAQLEAKMAAAAVYFAVWRHKTYAERTKIAARAGQNLKPSSLELGGSDAFIVLEDADLDYALHWAVWGRMYNDGQTCVAAKRFIVVEALAEQVPGRVPRGFGGPETGRSDG